MTRVDAHVHCWRAAPGALPWAAQHPDLQRDFDMPTAVATVESAGFQQAIVVQVETTVSETEILLRAAGHEEAVLVVVGWVDLMHMRAADDLAALRSVRGGGKLVGVRHPVTREHDTAWLTRPEVATNLHALGAANLTFDVLASRALLRHLPRLARRIPNLRSVLNHLGGAAEDGDIWPWANSMAELASLSNVAVKLSGVAELLQRCSGPPVSLADQVRTVTELFGVHRVMFGSDWPACLLASSYMQVVEATTVLLATLDAAEASALFGGAAVRRYPAPLDAARSGRGRLPQGRRPCSRPSPVPCA